MSLSPYKWIDSNIFLYKGGLSALKECGEKGEGEDGLARDWYMVGKGGLAWKGENIAKQNNQEEEKIIRPGFLKHKNLHIFFKFVFMKLM